MHLENSLGEFQFHADVFRLKNVIMLLLGFYRLCVTSFSNSPHICQVNGVSVVKVGHRQVVSLIRQGGSRLVMKVVSVTRKPDTGDVVRKKGSCPHFINACKPCIFIFI